MYCKCHGHVISECCTLERKRNNLSGDLLVSTVNSPVTCSVPPVKNSDESPSSTDYHPFVLKVMYLSLRMEKPLQSKFCVILEPCW